MKVIDIMTKKPHTINSDVGIFEAAQKMQSFDCGILPVTDGDDVVGVLTDRDIVTRVAAAGKDLKSLLVGKIMTLNPFFCKEEDSLQAAVRTMDQHHTRRLLVKDKKGQLTGILSLGDIIRRISDKKYLGEIFSGISIA